MAASKPFKKVCVIGAGVMGSGIAAHLANARIPVLLLDIVPPKYGDDDAKKGIKEDSRAFRDKFARSGVAKSLKAKPAPFFTKADAALIETGNLEDDIERVKECDWVIEVIIEKLAPKQSLFAKLEEVIDDESTIISSNTSGLEIADMLSGRASWFKKNFCVTHFFNPVRYLHLLEIVAGEQTDPEVIKRVSVFGENVLGKGIVHGKDTPNFVANRVGVYGMMETMRVMQEGDYTIEEVDAVFGTATGRAKSAVFRTADVVGLDTFVHVARNCWDNLPHDECHAVFKAPEFLNKMVENNWLGSKSGQGFYKKVKTEKGKEILSLDLKTMEYREKQKVRTESLGAIRGMEDTKDKLKHLFWADDRSGQLAWKVGMATNVYAANRLGEIADDIVQIDNGMKWGFGWELGPFETWDAIGVKESCKRWEDEGGTVPKWVHKMLKTGRETFFAWREDGTRTFWEPSTESEWEVPVGKKENSITLLKKNPTNIVQDDFATTLVDLGDGVLGIEFKTKMNAIDPDIIAGINGALDMCEDGKFDALVIANDGPNFCVGANLLLIFMAAQQKEWKQIDDIAKNLQQACQRLKYSHIPTVAATHQMALGGGCEVAMWCNSIRAHAETYIGLVEVGVGLIPGAGGNIEMLARTLENVVDSPTTPVEAPLQRALETVAMAKVATSAEQGRDMMFLSPSDRVSMNRSHLLEDAKWDALGMARSGFRAPRRRTYRLPGKSALATFDMALGAMRDGHYISDHDLKIALKVAHVMTGGDTSSRIKVSEEYLLDLEREAFLSLCGEEKTQARISHMLQKNKPLRN